MQAQYEPYSVELDAAEANIVQYNHSTSLDTTPEEEEDEYDIGVDLGVPKTRLDPLHDNLLMPEESFLEKMRSLNQHQYIFIMDLLHQIKISDESCGWKFLSGGAGVGKTHTTIMLYQCLLRILSKYAGCDPEELCILKVAPTGKAAFLIRGNTIHSALRIPVSRDLSVYSNLDSDALNSLRKKMRGLKYMIIDETSMVGNGMLNFIHKRLQEIFGSSKDFGGIQPIFVGDLFQLRPVMDSWIFQFSGNGYAALATNLWEKNVRMFELTEIMRQADDKSFAELLNRLREGVITQSDLDVIESRVIQTNDPCHMEIMKKPHFFLDNNKVNHHNERCFTNCSMEKKSIRSIDRVITPMNREKQLQVLSNLPSDVRKTQQLPQRLSIAVNLLYEIVLNIDTIDGLTNGSSCTVKKFDIPEGESAKGILWVLFDDKDVGSKRRKEYTMKKRVLPDDVDEAWTPVYAEIRRFNVGRKYTQVERAQFPLRASNGKTIHRSQGSSYSEAVVDLKGRCFAHAVYVALSRVRKLENLYILNFDKNKIKVDGQVVEEMQRLRNLVYPFSLTFLFHVKAKLKIAFLNAQSVHKHIQDIANDKTLMNADMFSCAETRLISRDPCDIDGYNIFRCDEVNETISRPVHGMLTAHREGVTCNKPIIFNNFGVEILLSFVHVEGSEGVYVISVYKPPEVCLENLYHALDICFQSIDCNAVNIVVMGDFNTNILEESYNTKELLEYMNSFGLKSKIQKYTTDFRTCIDHIYSNVENCLCDVGETYYSYHKVVWIALQ